MAKAVSTAAGEYHPQSTHGETAATEATMLILLAATRLAVDSSTSFSSFSSAFKHSLQ